MGLNVVGLGNKKGVSGVPLKGRGGGSEGGGWVGGCPPPPPPTGPEVMEGTGPKKNFCRKLTGPEKNFDWPKAWSKIRGEGV